MNTALLLIGGSVLGYLVLTGKASKMPPNQWLALILALLALNFARGGNFWMMGVCASLAAYLYVAQGRKLRAKHPMTTSAVEIKNARALLGVDEDADMTAIKTAWRTQLANNHPDRGGNEDMAQQINLAKDALLKELEATEAPDTWRY